MEVKKPDNKFSVSNDCCDELLIEYIDSLWFKSRKSTPGP
jgi:hypothetical protein